MARRRFTRRERWILGGVLATAVALAIAVVISLTAANGTSSGGCIDVIAPNFIGSTEVSGCGARARTICKSVGGSQSGYSRAADQALAAACRKQGIPVG